MPCTVCHAHENHRIVYKSEQMSCSINLRFLTRGSICGELLVRECNENNVSVPLGYHTTEKKNDLSANQSIERERTQTA